MAGDRIKIAYVMDHYAHPYGGTERQALELIRRLDRRRFAPRVAVFRASEYLERHEFDCPVDVLDIGKMASPRSVATLWRYARELRQSGVALVHVFFNDASIIGPPIMKWNDLRVVVSRRDMGFWYSSTNTLLLRANRSFVDRVVANSEAVKRAVRRSERYSDHKVAVIYNGYDPAGDTTESTRRQVRETLGIDRDGVVVGIVANLRAIKRIGDLVTAFARIAPSRPDLWLVVVGGGELRSELERLAESLNIGGRVVFTGRLPDPLPVIREFSVAVLCSESEGFSNSIIEYMNCGKPTVCTDTGGNPEIVREGENGYLVPVGDIERLAERIARLVDDPALAQRLGRNGLAQASEKYGMSKMIQAHMDLYERVLADGTATRRVGWRAHGSPGTASSRDKCSRRRGRVSS